MPQSKSPVEIADIRSRKRAILIGVGTLVFLLGQLLPLLAGDRATAMILTREVLWTVNAIVLLLILATGGGLLNRGDVRALINDEVSRSNYRASAIAGFWVAMVTALGLYLLPAAQDLTARETAYFIVTFSVIVASLAFSWLELRAHRDA